MRGLRQSMGESASRSPVSELHRELTLDLAQLEPTNQLAINALVAEGRSLHPLNVDTVQSLEMLHPSQLDVEPYLIALVGGSLSVDGKRLRRGGRRSEGAELGDGR